MVTVREAFEASLLVGVVLALVRRELRPQLARAVWAGALAAGVLSVTVGAVLVLTVGGLAGRARELAEGLLMWGAAGMLTYVLWWMGRHARESTARLRGETATVIASGSALALVALVFLSVFREGAETALYVAASAQPPHAVASGTGIGVVVGAAAGTAVYRGGTRVLDPRVFFRATTVLLLVFAAGLVGRATLALEAAGIFPGTISLWNTSGIVRGDSVPGAALTALVGYTPQPSALQLTFVAGYVGVLATLYTRPTGAGFVPLGHSYAQRFYYALRTSALVRRIPHVMGALLGLLLVVALLSLSIGPFDNHGPLAVAGFSSGENDANLFSFALWILWLPLLSIVTLVFARVWCGSFCPLRLVTDGARRLGSALGIARGAPASSAVRAGWLLPSSFVLVTFAVKSLPVQREARAGALFFLSIFVAAAVVGLLTRQGTWCRYLCPIGGWLARIARLSPFALRADPRACLDCKDKPCLTGAVAGRCPVALNPPRLESNQNCLACFACVLNCPPERSSLKVGIRSPAAELFAPRLPNLWESLFVASLLGMYAAAGHRSATLASLPWPVLFFGMIAAATVLYLAVCAVAAPLAGIDYRRAVSTFGYALLPLEFGTAVIAFGDDALEFLRITQTAAVLLIASGFAWSAVLLTSIVLNQSRSGRRALAAAVPLATLLVLVTFIWLHWYASGAVVDIT
ncbi:MAG TPA: FTR1 family protein [Gaiellaceae bacterium]|nr:FTR1 family protein [Gaiellaceae bacterium]